MRTHHADSMPLMRMGDTSVERIDGDLYRVRVDIRNDRLIPSIIEKARQNNVVRPDLLTVDGNVEIIAAGWVESKFEPGLR